MDDFNMPSNRNDYSYYSDGQVRFKQAVWNNCRNQDGPCSGCDLNNSKPQFGAFDTDAKLMVVAEAPGEGTGGSRTQDTNKENNDLDEVPNFLKYDKMIVDKWSQSAGSGGSLGYIDNLLRAENDLALTVEDVYYTNAIKCPKSDDNNETEDGRGNCRSYLKYEIQELVEPNVIIGFSGNAIQSVSDVLGVEQINGVEPSGNTSLCSLINQGDGRFPTFGDSPKLIPSPHWAMQNSFESYAEEHIDWMANPEDYWTILAETVSDSLAE